jgi:serine/threonine protein kinase
MPIIGLMPPTNDAGPIVLTPYSPLGSLSDVLKRVRQDNPPPFWTEEGKLRIITGLISGFQYLHSQGVVHREVKPSDLIVQKNGSILICGYLTSVLEEYKDTKASQPGALTYMAVELYEDRRDVRRQPDPKTDVFSFGLILYEILCGRQVFPQTLSSPAIMRRAVSAKAEDRPTIPTDLNPILRELIQKSWVCTPSERYSFEEMWNRLCHAQLAVS